MSDDSLNFDEDPITLVFRRRPGSRDAETAPDESELDTLVFRRHPAPPDAESALKESEQDAPLPDLTVKGDPAGDPSRIRPQIPEEIALLTGSLFDDLPRVEVPLETFFPAEYHNSAAWHRVRSDSLRPVAGTSAGRPPARRSSPNWFVGMAAAAVMGILAFALARRPATPSLAVQLAAPPPPATPAPAVESPRIEASSATTATPRPAPETDRSSVKPARAISVAPVTTDAAPGHADSTSGNADTTPAQADSVAARADSTPAPGPTAPSSEPVIADMPIAPPAPPPPPEVPPQQRTAIAVASAARGAASCLAPGDLRRTMAVRVTFAPSGRATHAVIEAALTARRSPEAASPRASAAPRSSPSKAPLSRSTPPCTSDRRGM